MSLLYITFMGYHYTIYRRIKIISIKSIDINVLLRNNMPFEHGYAKKKISQILFKF